MKPIERREHVQKFSLSFNFPRSGHRSKVETARRPIKNEGKKNIFQIYFSKEEATTVVSDATTAVATNITRTHCSVYSTG